MLISKRVLHHCIDMHPALWAKADAPAYGWSSLWRILLTSAYEMRKLNELFQAFPADAIDPI